MIDPPRPAGEGPWWTIVGWPNELEGPYRLRYWYDLVEGRPAIVGAELWGRSPVAQVWPLEELEPTPTVPLKSDGTRLKVPELLEGVFSHNRGAAQAALRLWNDANSVEQFEKRQALDETPERTGRAKKSPALLSRVARIYRDAVLSGKPYASEIATQLGVPESTARAWKRKAEQRGYLVAPGKSTMKGKTNGKS